MAEWKSINEAAPERGEFVLTSVKLNNTYYNEVLRFDTDDEVWKYNSGKTLENDRSVVGWKETGSTFLG